MAGEYLVDLHLSFGRIKARPHLDVSILVIAGWIRSHPGIIPMFNTGNGKNNAGFEMRDVYSTPRKRKYNFGDGRAYIVAVKQ